MLLEDESSSCGSTHSRDHFARSRGKQHMNSWQTEECLNPVRGIRDWQKRNGIVPHNHHKDNIAAIRAQSLANKAQRHQDDFNASRALPPFTPQLSSRSSAPRASSLYRSIPLRDGQGGATDFVYQNALATKVASVNAKTRRYSDKEENGEKWLKKESFGAVPMYLQTRKAELAEKYAEEQEQKVKNLIPPGMRIMPQSEREEMLGMLSNGQKDIESKISALPFVLETIGQKKKAEALHKRLEEIEEAITLFSRQTVLVEL